MTCVAQYQSDDFIQQNAITDKMFRDNTSLQHVELPGAITSIGNESFAHCMSLSSISMDGVKKIGESAFYGTQIDELTLNSGLTSLAQCSLSGTSKLLYVTMNQSELDGFNDNALRGASLTSIRFT